MKSSKHVSKHGQSQEALQWNLLNKVEIYIREGDISRAARLLTSSGLALDTAETLEKLKSKHPQSFVDTSPSDGNVATITIDREIFMKALTAKV